MSERPETSDPAYIRIRGARVHNLRGIDLDLPLDKFVVMTGLSGSGKSSLAFDTIHAEGQRRYIEGLSSQARQYLDQLERPDVDLIEGLPPTVSIDQKSGSVSPRSTVGTLTEILDHLRLLYARVGTPHCPQCGEAIRAQTAEQVVGGILGLGEGKKVIVLAPMVRGKKGSHDEAFRAIEKAQLVRARVDGEIVEVREAPKLAKTKVHDIEAVIDRLVIREGLRPRVAESVDLALKLGEGQILLSVQEDGAWVDRRFSTKNACPTCGIGFEPLEPRSFSFNSPHGACMTCAGLGVVSEFDPGLVLDESLSIDTGLVRAWDALDRKAREAHRSDPLLITSLKQQKLRPETPYSKFKPAARSAFWSGDGDFPGILAGLQAEWKDARSEARRSALNAFRVERTCDACHGSRLNPVARSVTVQGLNLPDLCRKAIDSDRQVMAGWTFAPPWDVVATPILREVDARLSYLERVGVGYLSLDRRADTLSGGELQRVRLANQIGSGLVGVCYVLDEPTAGLHPRDTRRLLDALIELKERGNSLIVVEHDESAIREADWLVDLGPGAGREGGRIVAQGPPSGLVETSLGASSTLRYLSISASPPQADPPRLTRSAGWLEVRGAREHNLKGIHVRFPDGCLIGVAGVSGSGKSTLVNEIVARAVRRALENRGPAPGAHDSIIGLDAFDKLVEIDQTPIGRSPRSTPSTFTGTFDEIRRLYARTKEAKLRGYTANRFSFNVKGGRCEACDGLGLRRIAMGFLPDLTVRCERCEGSRFNAQTLEIKFKGKSIGDVLVMRVDEAREFFDAIPFVKRGLDSLEESGLGYITLGQSSTTLSGGEAQRVKLAAELGRVGTGRTLYVLDEPTTGLHFADVERLLVILNRLADLGNTIVVIEHHTNVLRAADWLIELGPDGGDAGGQLVAEGTPAGLASDPASQTGPFLRGRSE